MEAPSPPSQSPAKIPACAARRHRATEFWIAQPSAKAYSGRLRRPEYAGHLEVRHVSAAETFRLLSRQYFLSNALKGEEIELEEVEDDIWSIVYYNTLLGRIDLRTGRITGIDKLQTMSPDFCESCA